MTESFFWPCKPGRLHHSTAPGSLLLSPLLLAGQVSHRSHAQRLAVYPSSNFFSVESENRASCTPSACSATEPCMPTQLTPLLLRGARRFPVLAVFPLLVLPSSSLSPQCLLLLLYPSLCPLPRRLPTHSQCGLVFLLSGGCVLLGPSQRPCQSPGPQCHLPLFVLIFSRLVVHKMSTKVHLSLPWLTNKGKCPSDHQS